jgi:hypothetical protein
MGLFKRNQPLSSTGHPGDDLTLRQLQKHGLGTTSPARWEHFVYCDDEAGAATLERIASETGWTVERVDPAYHGIVAERSDLVISPQAVAEARGFFEKLAASVPGGDYDGWGAGG